MFPGINSRMSLRVPTHAIRRPRSRNKWDYIPIQIFPTRSGAASPPECIYDRRPMDVSHEAVRLVDEANGHVVHKN